MEEIDIFLRDVKEGCKITEPAYENFYVGERRVCMLGAILYRKGKLECPNRVLTPSQNAIASHLFRLHPFLKKRTEITGIKIEDGFLLTTTLGSWPPSKLTWVNLASRFWDSGLFKTREICAEFLVWLYKGIEGHSVLF